MSTFDETAVEDMTYDLTKWGGPKGQIEEPSSDDITKYQRAFVKLLTDSGMDPAKIQSMEFKLDEVAGLLDTAEDLNLGLTMATSEVAKIPFDQLDKLPYRPKAAFIGWIMGEFLNPQR